MTVPAADVWLAVVPTVPKTSPVCCRLRGGLGLGETYQRGYVHSRAGGVEVHGDDTSARHDRARRRDLLVDEARADGTGRAGHQGRVQAGRGHRGSRGRAGLAGKVRNGHPLAARADEDRHVTAFCRLDGRGWILLGDASCGRAV